MKLRFTIRELILVTIIVALSVGWWLDRRDKQENAERYAHLERAMKQRYEGAVGVVIMYRKALINAGVEVPYVSGGTILTPDAK